MINVQTNDGLSREPTKAELTLLYLLFIGAEFTKAAGAGGDEGVRASFACILEGWFNGGQITDKGCAVVEANREAIEKQLGSKFPSRKPATVKVEITIVKERPEPRVFLSAGEDDGERKVRGK